MTTDNRGIRGHLEDFIKAYRSQPCLWAVKNKEYHNKDRKAVAYNKLLEVYINVDPNANRETIIKKINGMRTNYRKEKKKVEEFSSMGSIYVPQLWYYESLKFLDDAMKSTGSSSIIVEEPDIFMVGILFLLLRLSYKLV